MTDRIKNIAAFIFDKTNMDRAAARLCLDLMDEEPLAVDDMGHTGCSIPDLHVASLMDTDDPTFFGGKEKHARDCQNENLHQAM